MQDTHKSPLKTAPPTTLSEAERANGWTQAQLDEHIKQVAASEHAQLMNRLFPEKPPLRIENVSSFDPHNW